MGNRDTAVARAYWRDTFDTPELTMARGVGEEGGPDEPPKFKIYRGLPRYPLPARTRPELLTGDGTSGACGELTGDRLGTLLAYGYGLSRTDVGPLTGWPHHRVVPSARCFYPTELYLWLPADGPRPAGFFHYDQLHHALVELRRGDLAPLAAALDADLDGVAGVALLSSHLWKTAFRYRHYAYRLCTQESGMVAGNLLLVAGALGLRGHLHQQFLDRVPDRLLGLTPGQERTVAVLPLHPDGGPGSPGGVTRRSGTPAEADQVLGSIPVIEPSFLDAPGPKDLALAADAYACDQAGVLESTAEFAEPHLQPPPDQPGCDPVLLREDGPDAHEGDGPALTLPVALRGRTSGGTLFKPVRAPIPAAWLARLVRGALAPYDSDLGPAPLSSCYLVVQSVDGVPAGIYRLGRGEGPGTLWRVGPLPEGRIDAGMRLGPPALDFVAANVLAYVVGDRDAGTEWLGNRGYRILNQDAGVVAQRLCVGAATVGLAARVINGYSLAGVRELLGLTRPGAVPIFEIAFGRRTVSAQLELPVSF